MKKIRIAFVMNNLVYGGIEKFYLNYLENYDYLKDYKIDVLYSNIIDKDIQKKLNAVGVNIIKCKFGIENNKIKYINELISMFKKEKYNIVHSNLMQNDFCVLYAAKKARIKTRISHCHMNMRAKYVVYTKSKLKLIGRYFKILLTNYYSTDRFACSSESGKSMFKKSFHVVYNAIDENKFKYSISKRSKLRKRYSISDKDKLLGFVGRLSNEKNPEFVVDLFDMLSKNNGNYRLLIIGTGRKKEQIMNKIHNNKNVIIIDPVSNIEDYYNMMDVLVFPSISEGLGMVAIEAQYNGLPVVASNTIPIETNISNYISYVSLDNLDEWIKIVELFSNKKHEDAVFFKNKERFDIKKEANKLFDLYRKLVEKNEKKSIN